MNWLINKRLRAGTGMAAVSDVSKLLKDAWPCSGSTILKTAQKEILKEVHNTGGHQDILVVFDVTLLNG
jgi:hypothetical protein